MTLRILLPSIISVFLTACGGGGTPASADSISSSAKCTIELNADSIMDGVGIERFSASLQKLRPNFVIDDRAVSGLTLRSVYNGYTTVAAGGPFSHIGPQMPFNRTVRNSKVVLIELGGNDAIGLADADVFKSQLEDMINIIISEGRIPVLTGIVSVAPGDIISQAAVIHVALFVAIVDELSIKYNVLNAHWSTVEFNGTTDTIDGIHWKQIPQDRLVARTIEVLDIACAQSK